MATVSIGKLVFQHTFHFTEKFAVSENYIGEGIVEEIEEGDPRLTNPENWEPREVLPLEEEVKITSRKEQIVAPEGMRLEVAGLYREWGDGDVKFIGGELVAIPATADFNPVFVGNALTSLLQALSAMGGKIWKDDDWRDPDSI